MRVVISGIGVAGPTLAYWLTGAGHEVLLVEDAPRFRAGGYIIDFWGAGYDVAERMGLLPRITTLGYDVQELRFVDDRGRRRGGFSTDVIRRATNGRWISLRRSDLSAAIYAALDKRVETTFDNSIQGLEEHGESVRVRFRRGPPCDVDLVIGADGLHSAVRRLAFGPHAAFEVPLGYHVAAFEVTGYRPRDELVYVSHAVPGRQVSRFALRDEKTLFLFLFRDDHLPGRGSASALDPKAAVTGAFAGVGWECPQILDAMKDVADVYFDSVSQIRMDHWTRHRTALIGDAAACISLLGGEGTGLAMAEAYILAQALRTSSGLATALARYEECLMPLLSRKQASAARFASSFAPKTAIGIEVRNLVTRLFRLPLVADYFIGRDLRDESNLLECGF